MADVSVEVETDSADDAIVTVGQLSSLLQNYTAMSVRPYAFLLTVLLEVILVLACERFLYSWSWHHTLHVMSLQRLYFC